MLALRSFSEKGRVNPPHNFKKEVMWGMKEVRSFTYLEIAIQKL